eukprot:gene13923-19853_t
MAPCNGPRRHKSPLPAVPRTPALQVQREQKPLCVRDTGGEGAGSDAAMSDEEMLFDWETQEPISSYQDRCTTAKAAAVYEQASEQVAMLQSLDSSVTAKICSTLIALQRVAPCGSLTASSIASSLTAVDIPCRLRRAVVEKGEGSCLRRLRHSFVVVQIVGAPEVYVDPQFKEQFQLARSDPIHDAFLRALPPIFVGTELTLRPLVKLAAEQCLAALDRLRLDRPPWRDVSALMSKWLPEKYTDENVSWPATIPAGSSHNLQRMSALSERFKQPPRPPVLRRDRGAEVVVPMKVSELKPTKVIHGFSMKRFPPSSSQPQATMQLGDTGERPFAGAAAVANVDPSNSEGQISVERAVTADAQALNGLALLRLHRPAQTSAECSTGVKSPLDEAVAEMRAGRKVEMRKRRSRVLEKSQLLSPWAVASLSSGMEQ